MEILVTGATGLVGARLLPRLVDDGHDCRALVRREGTAPRAAREVIGDLADGEALASAVSGVAAIVHLAAVFRTTDADRTVPLARQHHPDLIIMDIQLPFILGLELLKGRRRGSRWDEFALARSRTVLRVSRWTESTRPMELVAIGQPRNMATITPLLRRCMRRSVRGPTR